MHRLMLIGPLLASLLLLPAPAFCQGRFTFSDPDPRLIKRIGYVNPLVLEVFSGRPETLKTAPSGLVKPLYGILPIGAADTARGRAFHVILDQPAEGKWSLYVDSEGRGEMGDAKPLRTEPISYGKGLSGVRGTASITLSDAGTNVAYGIGVYRLDPRDPDIAERPDCILYYSTFARQGAVKLGGKIHQGFLFDESASGDLRTRDARLFIDLNDDGAILPDRESIDMRRPFNIGGTTYEVVDIAPLGGTLRIAVSSKSAQEMLPPPDLRVGKTAAAFKAVDMDGKPVDFPLDYAGKLVLLDFWATWCGPCMQELPTVAEAYATYKARGFDILGVTLDNAGQDGKIRSLAKSSGMGWRQVYDGKAWKARIAVLYMIDSIPRAFLVDGDTGKILAMGDEVRGEGLAAAIEKALKKKGKM